MQWLYDCCIIQTITVIGEQVQNDILCMMYDICGDIWFDIIINQYDWSMELYFSVFLRITIENLSYRGQVMVYK